MKMFTDRKWAIVFALCICAAYTLVCGARQLERFRTQAEASLKAELAERVELGFNYFMVADRNLNSDPATLNLAKANQNLEAAIDKGAHRSAKQLLAANAELTAAYTAVYLKLADVEMGGDTKYRSGLYQDLESVNSRIANAGYNEMAESYNDKLGGALANGLRRLGMAKVLPLYER